MNSNKKLNPYSALIKLPHNQRCTDCNLLMQRNTNAYYSHKESNNTKRYHCPLCESKRRGLDNGDMR